MGFLKCMKVQEVSTFTETSATCVNYPVREGQKLVLVFMTQ